MSNQAVHHVYPIMTVCNNYTSISAATAPMIKAWTMTNGFQTEVTKLRESQNFHSFNRNCPSQPAFSSFKHKHITFLNVFCHSFCRSIGIMLIILLLVSNRTPKLTETQFQTELFQNQC